MFNSIAVENALTMNNYYQANALAFSQLNVVATEITNADCFVNKIRISYFPAPIANEISFRIFTPRSQFDNFCRYANLHQYLSVHLNDV